MFYQQGTHHTVLITLLVSLYDKCGFRGHRDDLISMDHKMKYRLGKIIFLSAPFPSWEETYWPRWKTKFITLGRVDDLPLDQSLYDMPGSRRIQASTDTYFRSVSSNDWIPTFYLRSIVRNSSPRATNPAAPIHSCLEKKCPIGQVKTIFHDHRSHVDLHKIYESSPRAWNSNTLSVSIETPTSACQEVRDQWLSVSERS